VPATVLHVGDAAVVQRETLTAVHSLHAPRAAPWVLHAGLTASMHG
jgi:hypothetical protein